MIKGRKYGAHTQAVRTIRILRLLDCGGRYTIERLAADHGVHWRTIRRDLAALVSAGEPIAIIDSHVTRIRGANLNPAAAEATATRHAERNRERGFRWICSCPSCRVARARGFTPPRVEPALADAAE